MGSQAGKKMASFNFNRTEHLKVKWFTFFFLFDNINTSLLPPKIPTQR